ncbi:DUF4331 family protein [Mycolicibacterium fluoranthenivorans]|jgi:hypothetical protein|uniref:DUF4331 family protein n=1 Tax=Mycolicibacterium fluoranthenivorans TaxID=258505 RepID=A0A1G4WND8_9MYCO|nr:DUF4331 family protein [Mycolicibacterium fluoranthenivorans]QNJ94410.1 DUF4331 family protein [Mycolicibacterium fluoranthenivorans]SCX26289.1 protein of unknown function [Mycolicibacterium fluoranthenivorans]
MSHHLDSPLARQDIRLDITDLYVFAGQTGTALVINVCHSFGGDVPVPGFHPEGRYEFKMDLDGDAVEDLTYRVTFDAADEQGHQRFSVHRLSGAAATDPQAAGTELLCGRTGVTVTTAAGVRAWAGRAGDPFWIDADILHAVGHALQDGTTIDVGTWAPERAANLFAGATVHSLVLELPDAELTPRRADNRIAVWTVATLATDAGGWRSINRVGLPMIHPLFTQYDEHLGDALNAGVPRDDYATYGESVAARVAACVGAYGTASDPDRYGETVAHLVFPNVLPYTVGTAAVFGFAGFNGRSLIDNAPEVMFSLAFDTPVTIGVGAESVTVKPSSVFPYVPTL